MTSAGSNQQTQQILVFATLLPKPVARALASLYLRLRGHFRVVVPTFIGVCLLCTFLVTRNEGGFSTFRADAKLPAFEHRSYASSVVTDCVHRTPETEGRTFETNVRGVGVSFVSWTQNATYDKDHVLLRVHEAVRLMSKLRRAGTLLDVGANIGKVTFPVLAMHQMHSVVAVEPVSTNVNMLCMTANLNGWLGNAGLTLLEAAMSDAEGELEIFVPEGREDNAALSSEAATANVHEHKHGEQVKVLVGDNVLQDGGFKPDLIKIDTQGHELHVLKGLKGYLKKAAPESVLVMAESDPKLMALSGVDPKEIYQLMTVELGYASYCRPTIDVVDGTRFQVSGTALSRETYPPGGCRDIFYFKHVR